MIASAGGAVVIVVAIWVAVVFLIVAGIRASTMGYESGDLRRIYIEPDPTPPHGIERPTLIPIEGRTK